MNCNRLLLFTGLALIWATTSAQSPTTPGAYTEAQAANGKKNYDRYCADCHHMSLKGTGHGPELAGPNFLAKWSARPTSELILYNSELMPPQAPGSLGESINVDITAHMLRINGGVAGDEALQADSGLLVGAAIGVEIKDSSEAVEGEEKWESWEKAGTIEDVARAASGFINKEVADFMPVTDQMLQRPPPADWLSWRRTLDGPGLQPA